MKIKFTSLILAVLMLVSVIEPVTLKAMENGNWFDDAVNFVLEEGLMFEESGDFKPTVAVTIGDALLAVYNLVGKPDIKIESSFTDIAGGKYEKPVKWAKSIGLIKVFGDKMFKPYEKITREEMAQLLAEISEVKGFKATRDDTLIKKALDYDKIRSKDLDGMIICYNLGLIKGRNDALHPNSKMLRAELAQTLKNFFHLPRVSGKAISMNKYGNVVTDISVKSFNNAGFEPGDIITVEVGSKLLDMPYGDTYSNVDNKKEIIVPDNDSGNMVVAINMGNFAKNYGVSEGTEMSFKIAEKAGYLDEYEIRNIDKFRTNNREDYSTDEIFANFRPIVMGSIPEGIIYRSSSPVNPMLGRAEYSDKLAKAAGIKTVINLADSKEELEEYFLKEDFASDYYKRLYDKGQVIYLDLGVDFSDDDFNLKLKKGLEFMIKNEGPFLIHCNEGKDRAGFVSAILEALMGAGIEEIKEDYMLSFVNYYHVKKGSARYEKIANSNIMESLKMIAGVDNIEELSRINIQEAAQKFLIEKVGLTPAQVRTTKNLLLGNAKIKKAA